MPPSTYLAIAAAALLMLLLGGGLARCNADGLDDEPPPGIRRAAETTVADDAPASSSAPASPPPTGVVADPGSLLVLVDRERFLPDGYRPLDLVEAPVAWAPADDAERRLLRAEAARHLADLFDAAAEDGRPLLAISGFRSYETQRGVRDRSVRANGPVDGHLYTAEPGHSEHQTGLAVDVVGADGTCVTEPCFAATPAGIWVEANAHRFGFIIRYPRDGERITGYAYEPWHLRYVGAELAADLHTRGITLDQYLGVA